MGSRVRSEGWWLPAVLTAVALVLRLPDIGNPLIDLDEQFYVLVGERMWAGAIPYVDIWDRKPVGLFALYWFARGFGGDPWIGYQVLATAAAVATAVTIAAIATRLAERRAGLAAGVTYLVWIALLGGRGGQAPVFYDAPIALAALVTLRTLDTPVPGWRRGIGAMLLVGLATQIKPTVVAEGAWLGLVLLVAAWRGGARRGSARHRRLAVRAAALASAALLPTLIAFGAYLAIGHGDAWWFANVDSILLRRVPAGEPIAARLTGIALVLLILAGAGAYGLSRLRGDARWVMAGWLAVAVLAVAAVPPYFNHYALPLVVPLAVLAGVAMAASRGFTLLVGAAAAGLLAYAGYPHWGERHDARARVAALAATIERYRGDGCLFVFSAPPVWYEATGSCLPTRYPFASHLTLLSEAGAIGVDPLAETRRILASRPPVILAGPPVGRVDPRPYALVDAAIARDYRRVGGDLGYTVYARADRIMPPPAGNP